MNAAARMLRDIAEAGLVDTYPCPCRAQGQLVETHPMIFTITYRHDDDCPQLTGQTPA